MKKNKEQSIKKYISLFLIVGILISFNPLTVTAKSSISEKNIFKLINKERNKSNLSSLTLNNKLVQAAINKAKDLSENKYFDHNSENGKKFSSWIKETGYEYSFIGENLAKDFNDSESIIKAWLKSPGHKKNILNNNFTETGIAVYGNIVVQIFGRPELMPLPLQETIGQHLSENLILYTSDGNRLIDEHFSLV